MASSSTPDTSEKSLRERLQDARLHNRYPFSKAPFDKRKSGSETQTTPTSKKDVPEPEVSRTGNTEQGTGNKAPNRGMTYFQREDFEAAWGTAKKVVAKVTLKNGKKYSDVMEVPSEIPGLDLMLAISMTTAFASLTDNTDILTGDGALSYLCFFALVWWIWASQVAYNARFRHRDVLHCIYAFLTFIAYGGLAAFTGDFDITDSLVSDSQSQQVSSIKEGLGLEDQTTVSAEQTRASQLPNLNARGISLVMALSRALLLLQYFLLLRRAPETRRSPLRWHCGGLFISTGLYLAAYFLLRRNNSEAANIWKIGLWYGVMLLEVATHYIANKPHKGPEGGPIEYRSAALSKRMSELFIIILGAGLDQITKSFHNEVGTLGFGTHTVGIMILSGVIVVGEFSLWFINKPKSVNQEEQDEERKDAKEIAKEKNDDHPVLTSDYVEDPEESAVSPPDMNRGYSANTNSDTIKSAGTGSVGVSVLQVSAEKETPKAYKRSDGEPSDQRLLTWFLFNFVFLACIILTLQAIAHLVAYDNLQSAFVKLLGYMETVVQGDYPLDASNYPEVDQAFTELGISFSDFIQQLNIGESGILKNSSDNSSAGLLVTAFSVPITTLFQNFDVAPDPGSLLAAQLDLLGNDGIPYESEASQILSNVEISQIRSALWFFGVAGGTLMALAVMNAIRHHYKDIFLWISIILRFLSGLGFALLSILDIGPALTVNSNFEPLPGIAIVWRFVRTSWILGSFGILISSLTAVDAILQYFAASRYKNDNASGDNKPQLPQA